MLRMAWMNEDDDSVWRTVFKAFDRDSSGRIDRTELTRALRNLGGKWTPDRIATALDQYDADALGALTFAQFKALATGADPLVDPELVRSFRALDLDGDGQITVEELIGIFRAAGVEADGDVVSFVREADTNQDGAIQFDEFIALARQTDL